MTQSLLAKLLKLQPTNTTSEPTNARLQQAAIYRTDQREIVISLLAPFQTYLRSLVAPDPRMISQMPCLVRLETFVAFCEKSNMLPSRFMDGIEANSRTSDLEQLILAGWEQDVWVLLLCSLVVSNADFFDHLPDYVKVGEEADAAAPDGDHPSQELMDLVSTAAATCPGSVWENEAWSPGLISRYAKLLQFDSFLIMCLREDGSEDELRLCIYHDASSR